MLKHLSLHTWISFWFESFKKSGCVRHSYVLGALPLAKTQTWFCTPPPQVYSEKKAPRWFQKSPFHPLRKSLIVVCLKKKKAIFPSFPDLSGRKILQISAFSQRCNLADSKLYFWLKNKIPCPANRETKLLNVSGSRSFRRYLWFCYWTQLFYVAKAQGKEWRRTAEIVKRAEVWKAFLYTPVKYCLKFQHHVVNDKVASNATKSDKSPLGLWPTHRMFVKKQFSFFFKHIREFWYVCPHRHNGKQATCNLAVEKCFLVL